MMLVVGTPLRLVKKAWLDVEPIGKLPPAKLTVAPGLRRRLVALIFAWAPAPVPPDEVMVDAPLASVIVFATKLDSTPAVLFPVRVSEAPASVMFAAGLIRPGRLTVL